MKKFLEHIEEEKTDEVVYGFYELIETQLKKKGIDIEENENIGVKFFGFNKDNKKEAIYEIAPYWSGYIPDVIKLLNNIQDVLQPLNSYPDMIIMNWFVDQNHLIIKVIWDNFKKTDLYKSLKTTGKYNL
jgi:hypothetical protein